MILNRTADDLELTTDQHGFSRIFCYAVSTSGKSGKSEDNNKKSVSLAEQCLHFVLSTDDHDFTDFCYASGLVGPRPSFRLIRQISRQQ